MTTTVKFRMEPGCEELAPAKAHHDDAAYDLRSRESASIPPGQFRLVKTGLFLELPEGFEAQVRPRSGLALKHGITVLNTPGTIDAGYRGEVGVILINHGAEPFVIRRGERIAQLVIVPVVRAQFTIVPEFTPSQRGTGGFGHSGRH